MNWASTGNPNPVEQVNAAFFGPYMSARPARSELDSNASCPAATGELACKHFPDAAHRCAGARNGHTDHRCTCGKWWTVREVDL